MTTPSPSKSWDQRLFTLLWVWLTIRTTLPWLVFFRLTLEGDSYSWGSEYFGLTFHSSGLARLDFLLVYALLAVSLFLLWNLRRFNFRLARPLLLLYLGFFAANAIYQLLAGEPILFHGDTLGVKLNVTILFFVLNFGMFAVGLAWWWGTRTLPAGAEPPAVPPKDRTVLKACVAFVPVQIALLVFGEPHALTDEIGVIGTLIQWILIAAALYPGSGYRQGG